MTIAFFACISQLNPGRHFPVLFFFTLHIVVQINGLKQFFYEVSVSLNSEKYRLQDGSKQLQSQLYVLGSQIIENAGAQQISQFA